MRRSSSELPSLHEQPRGTRHLHSYLNVLLNFSNQTQPLLLLSIVCLFRLTDFSLDFSNVTDARSDLHVRDQYPRCCLLLSVVLCSRVVCSLGYLSLTSSRSLLGRDYRTMLLSYLYNGLIWDLADSDTGCTRTVGMTYSSFSCTGCHRISSFLSQKPQLRGSVAGKTIIV